MPHCSWYVPVTVMVVEMAMVTAFTADETVIVRHLKIRSVNGIRKTGHVVMPFK